MSELRGDAILETELVYLMIASDHQAFVLREVGSFNSWKVEELLQVQPAGIDDVVFRTP
jgi:hypothetical protein